MKTTKKQPQKTASPKTGRLRRYYNNCKYKNYVVVGAILVTLLLLFFSYVAFERYQLHRAEKTINTISKELSTALPSLGQPTIEKYCTYPSTKMPTLGTRPTCAVSASYERDLFNEHELDTYLKEIHKTINDQLLTSYINTNKTQDKGYLEFEPKNTAGVSCILAIGNNIDMGIVELVCSTKTLFQYYGLQ